jgi:hypothetical protein
MFTWVECYGGPADGETVPVDPMDPLPEFPYMTVDLEVHHYHLRSNEEGHLRFFYERIIPTPGWQPVSLSE